MISWQKEEGMGHSLFNWSVLGAAHRAQRKMWKRILTLCVCSDQLTQAPHPSWGVCSSIRSLRVAHVVIHREVPPPFGPSLISSAPQSLFSPHARICESSLAHANF